MTIAKSFPVRGLIQAEDRLTMDSNPLVADRLPVSSSQIHITERPLLTNGNPFEVPTHLNPRHTTGEIEVSKNYLTTSHQFNEQTGPISFIDSSSASKSPTVLCHSTSADANDTVKINDPSAEGLPITPREYLSPNPATLSLHCSEPSLANYTNAQMIPGTNQYLYPHAPIKAEFKERYPQLVDFFRRAVDDHKVLKYHTKKINYQMRVCGATPSSAVPSIIVICTEAIFKAIRSLFDCRHIRLQYQREWSLATNKFQFIPSNSRFQNPTPSIVPFKIVYWRVASTPIERKSAMERIDAQSHSPLTLCGSLVRYGDRRATLGLLISVDSKLYGLTVDHLFSDQSPKREELLFKYSDTLLPERDEVKDNEEEGERLEHHWLDDVTYDATDYDGEIMACNGSEIRWPSDVDANAESAFTKHLSEPISGHKLDAIHEMPPSNPYLDWALIQFDDESFKRPNAFYPKDGGKLLHLLTKASPPPGPSDSNIPVFMISGSSKARKGILVNADAYIGGEPGQTLCKAWNVILCDDIGKF